MYPRGLKEIPAVNAEIDGQDLIYKNYYHVGVAVGTEKGLVVPVVRDADHLSLAEVEKTIAGFGKRARDGQLKIEDMQGAHVHDQQRWRLRLADVDADPQRAAVRHFGNGTRFRSGRWRSAARSKSVR